MLSVKSKAAIPIVVVALAMQCLGVMSQYKVEILSTKAVGRHYEVKAQVPWEPGHEEILSLLVYCSSGNVYVSDYQQKWAISPFKSVNAFVLATVCK